jgi:AcrR family transcriptional regulator
MSTIAARCGGSKATIYNYFSSKEELFEAVIERKCEEFSSALYDAEFEGGDLRNALTLFGERIVGLFLSDDTVATYRLVTTECARFPKIGRMIFNSGPRWSGDLLRKFIARAKESGQLRPDADIAVAVEQFFALCLAEIHQRRLGMVTPVPTPRDIRARLDGAVSTFILAFGV